MGQPKSGIATRSPPRIADSWAQIPIAVQLAATNAGRTPCRDGRAVGRPGADVLVDAVHHLVEVGVAVLVVEQNLRAAARMAERQLVMVSGRIEAEFAGDELTTRPDLHHRYLGVGTATTHRR